MRAQYCFVETMRAQIDGSDSGGEQNRRNSTANREFLKAREPEGEREREGLSPHKRQI